MEYFFANTYILVLIENDSPPSVYWVFKNEGNYFIFDPYISCKSVVWD